LPGLTVGVLFHRTKTCAERISKKCTSLSGPNDKDLPNGSNRVLPNLLFAQQISMFCCFGDGQEWNDGEKTEFFPYKKRIYAFFPIVAFRQQLGIQVGFPEKAAMPGRFLLLPGLPRAARLARLVQ
jgi:hypothetical protein